MDVQLQYNDDDRNTNKICTPRGKCHQKEANILPVDIRAFEEGLVVKTSASIGHISKYGAPRDL